MSFNEPFPASFTFIFGLFKKQTTNVKNVYLVSRAGIWTHDLWNMSLRP